MTLRQAASKFVRRAVISILPRKVTVPISVSGHTDLGAPLTSMFRLENVVAKRRDKINSDEEERLRLGYELKTGIRFLERSGRKLCQTGAVLSGGAEVASMTYGHASTIWRINRGWRRCKDK